MAKMKLCLIAMPLAASALLRAASGASTDSSGPFRFSVQLAPKLPAMMADFAVQRETGEIAAVSPVTNQAYLFERDSLFHDQAPVPAHNTSLDSAPIGITFKRFGSDVYFAVVCLQEENMYILNASTMELIEKVPTSGKGSLQVFSSQNPEDPFIYYTFHHTDLGDNWDDNDYYNDDDIWNGASGDPDSLRAVNVARMEDTEVWMDHDFSTNGAAISADGLTLYNQGKSVPFSSYSMDSAWNARKPNFRLIYCERGRSGVAFVPGPFNEFVAFQQMIYPNGLANVSGLTRNNGCSSCCPYSSYNSPHSEIAVLDFDVAVFAASEPLAFGFRFDNNGYYYGVRPLPKEVTAIWTEDFQATKHNLTIPPGLLDKVTNPGSLFSTLDRKMLTNDVFDELVIGYADRIGTASFQCFTWGTAAGINSLNRELLQVDSLEFTIGKGVQTATFTSPSMSLLIDTLPGGASYDPATQTISWAPDKDYVGNHTVDALLADGNSTCAVSFDLTVAFPSFDLAYVAQGFGLSDDGNFGVVWSVDRNTATKTNITSIEWATAQNSAKIVAKTFGFGLGRLVVGNGIVVVFDQTCGMIHVLDIKSLDLIATKTNPVKIESYQCRGDDRYFRVESGYLHICPDCSETAVFNLTDFSRAESEIPYYYSPSFDGLELTEGVVKNGILYDHLGAFDRKLVLDPGPFVTGIDFTEAVGLLGGGDVTGSFFDDDGFSPSNYDPFSFLHEVPKPRSQLPLVEIPGSGMFVQMELGQEVRTNTETTVNATLWVVDLVGNVVDSFVFFNITKDRYRYYSYPSPVVLGKNKTCYVLYGKNIFQWSLDGPSQEVSNTKFHFEPRQSMFRIDADGQSELVHNLKGGKGPYEVFFEYSHGSGDVLDINVIKSLLALNKTTGTVTVDGPKFAKAAMDTLVSFGVVGGIAEVRTASLKKIEPWNGLAQEDQPVGIPVGLPISLHAVDGHGESATLFYTVYMDVMYEELAPLVTAAIAEFEREKAKNKTGDDEDKEDIKPPPAEPSNGGSGDNMNIEILLLLLVVVLLVVILAVVVCFAMYKFVLTKREDGNLPDVVGKEESAVLVGGSTSEASSTGAAEEEAAGAAKEEEDGELGEESFEDEPSPKQHSGKDGAPTGDAFHKQTPNEEQEQGDVRDLEDAEIC